MNSRRRSCVNRSSTPTSVNRRRRTTTILATETPYESPLHLESTVGTTVYETPESHSIALNLSGSSDDSLSNIDFCQKKDINAILESEYESSEVFQQQKLPTNHRRHLEDVILPCDMNDEAALSRRLKSIQLNKKTPRSQRRSRAPEDHDQSGSPVLKRRSLDSCNSTLYLNEDLELTSLIASEINKSLSSPSKSTNLPIEKTAPLEASIPSTLSASTVILTGVIAYVEVRSEFEDRSNAIGAYAESLGAEVLKNFNKTVTHVIFKDGTMRTYQKAERLGVHLVSTLWLAACAEKKEKVPEVEFPATDPMKDQNPLLPHKPKRFKCMQPKSFEEDERAALAKIKKKWKSAKPEDPCPKTPKTPLTQLCHMNSPRSTPKESVFRLLSPHVRAKYSSDSQTEVSDEELNTPLATRLFKKYFSPVAGRKFDFENVRNHDPMSPIVETLLKTDPVDVPQESSNPDPENRIPEPIENCTAVPIEPAVKSPRKLRRSTRLFSREIASPSLNKSILKDINSPRRVPRNSVSFTEKNTKENVSMNGSALSQINRRHRLHTQESINEDLIMPCSPISPPTVKASVYSNLEIRPVKTQRQALTKTNAGCIALPRPVKTVSEPGPSRSESPLPMDTDPVPDPFDTPRSGKRNGRFSLVANRRKSRDEFKSEPVPKVRRQPKKVTQKQPTICLTSFHSVQLPEMYSIINSLGGFGICTNVDETTSHVVCGGERRTVNVLRAITAGAWVLDVSWLYESLELHKWAPEEPFELFNFCPGAKVTRKARQEENLQNSDIFGEFGKIFIESTCVPPRQVIGELLRRCNGNQSFTIRSARIAVGKGSSKRPGLTRVNEKWILDSIQLWKAQPIQDYIIE